MGRLARKSWLALVAMLFMGVVQTAFAQDPQAGFVVRETLGPQETLPHAQLLMAAYAFVWLTLLVYLWTLWRRIVRVERDLVGVTQQLRERKR